MIKRLEVKIFGRVQLVMFRDFVARKANSLGLSGTVENVSDGSVFVAAEGEETKLEELLVHLKKGPLFASVERIDAKWLEIPSTPEGLSPTGESGKFKIIFYERR